MCFLGFLDFWISSAGEREITSGNLPLSEVPPSEYLTEYRRIPEEFRTVRGSPEERFPAEGVPAWKSGSWNTSRHHVPEGTVADLYIYICISDVPRKRNLETAGSRAKVKAASTFEATTERIAKKLKTRLRLGDSSGDQRERDKARQVAGVLSDWGEA